MCFFPPEPTAEPMDETTLDAFAQSPTTEPADETWPTTEPADETSPIATEDTSPTDRPTTTARPGPKAADVVDEVLTGPDLAPVCSPVAPVVAAAVPSAKPSDQVDITLCREFAPSYYYCETPEAVYVVQMVG